jgi:UDP-N-acetylmuramyl pentapeptide phosphotransferase/UDP-N-acetylglucosamine-1-phosphate transferase
MLVRATWAVALVLLVFASCGSEEDETQIAVKNSGMASISAAVSDGHTELRFDGVPAAATSPFQTATFGSPSGLTVSVASATSMIALTEGARNVVDIGADGKVVGVFLAVSSGPEGGGGW